jgi:hypothetical protein
MSHQPIAKALTFAGKYNSNRGLGAAEAKACGFCLAVVQGVSILCSSEQCSVVTFYR